MFEKLRQSLDDLLARATKPEDRRAVLSHMKEALVHARMGIDDLRTGIRETQKRLEAERRELDTVARRKALALNIRDAETVAVAERFERQHGDRVRMLEAKLQVQEAELALVEREVEGMAAELRSAMAGVPLGARGAGTAADPLAEPPGDPAGERRADSGAGGAGGAGGGPSATEDDPLADGAATLESEISAAARAGRRARLEQDADARLAELKRRMGK